MKNHSILFSIMLLSVNAFSQVEGNGISKTLEIPLKSFTTIISNVNADILVDCNLKNQIILTTDQNLIPYYAYGIAESKLMLESNGWLQAKIPLRITIGTETLERFEMNSNGLVHIKGLNQHKLVIQALSGKMKLNGKVNELQTNQESSLVDASNLKVIDATIKIWDIGSIKINASGTVVTDVSKKALISFITPPQKIIGNYKTLNHLESNDADIQWIKFKIKNNTLNRNQFYVVGPKKDGSRFSYGFPMMPGAVRKEDWTVGSKVYLVNRLGVRKLLITIKIEDEGKTVELFK